MGGWLRSLFSSVKETSLDGGALALNAKATPPHAANHALAPMWARSLGAMLDQAVARLCEFEESPAGSPIARTNADIKAAIRMAHGKCAADLRAIKAGSSREARREARRECVGSEFERAARLFLKIARNSFKGQFREYSELAVDLHCEFVDLFSIEFTLAERLDQLTSTKEPYWMEPRARWLSFLHGRPAKDVEPTAADLVNMCEVVANIGVALSFIHSDDYGAATERGRKAEEIRGDFLAAISLPIPDDRVDSDTIAWLRRKWTGSSRYAPDDELDEEVQKVFDRMESGVGAMWIDLFLFHLGFRLVKLSGGSGLIERLREELFQSHERRLIGDGTPPAEAAPRRSKSL